MGLSREILRQHVWVEGWISWEQKRVSNKRKTALLRVLRPQALFSFSALSTCSKETWTAETQHPWYVVGKLFLLLVREMSGSWRRLAALSRSLSNSFRRLWPRLLNNCCSLCLLIGYNFRNSRTERTPLPLNAVLSRTGSHWLWWTAPGAAPRHRSDPYNPLSPRSCLGAAWGLAKSRDRAWKSAQAKPVWWELCLTMSCCKEAPAGRAGAYLYQTAPTLPMFDGGGNSWSHYKFGQQPGLFRTNFNALPQCKCCRPSKWNNPQNDILL